MTTIRPFELTDLFHFSNVNLDALTETYGLSFYLQYFINWPNYFQIAQHPNGMVMGYIMGKAVGRDRNWHGHVTAVSVAPQFRRMKLAATFMDHLEKISEKNGCYFVDLFVRVSNAAACNMYRNLGYVVYRRIIDYYTGEVDEDGFDMRKSLSKDANKESMIPLKNPVRYNDLETD